MVMTKEKKPESRPVRKRKGKKVYMKDSQGRLVPVTQVPEIDKARDMVVKDLFEKAKQASGMLAQFKTEAGKALAAFLDLSAGEYNTSLGGKKGNVTLTSFDGSYKVEIAVNDFISFDERLQVAKSLIDECILDWSKDSKPEIVALVNDAFQVNKKGKVDVPRILSLRKLDIRYGKWQRAMDAISNSINISGSRKYLRFYKRDPKDEKYKQILLDFSSL